MNTVLYCILWIVCDGPLCKKVCNCSLGKLTLIVSMKATSLMLAFSLEKQKLMVAFIVKLEGFDQMIDNSHQHH